MAYQLLGLKHIKIYAQLANSVHKLTFVSPEKAGF